MFKSSFLGLTQTVVRDMIKLRKGGVIMKMNLKIIALIYLGVIVLTYAMTLRIDRLESMEDQANQTKSIVLKLK